MLDTVSDYVTQARVLLQDQVNSPYRYSDAELVMALNMGLSETRRLRPDLFINKSLVLFTANDATAVVMDPMYRVAHLYYIVGQAQLRDDEAVQDQRASAFISMHKSMLLSL